MAQVTLYLDDALMAKLRESAAGQRLSQSQFVANLIRQAVGEHWPAEVLMLAGALPGFPHAEELRAPEGTDAARLL
ncbi:MAG: ribbon-helix-helix protein, CopG family [Rubrivivax sp.]